MLSLRQKRLIFVGLTPVLALLALTWAWRYYAQKAATGGGLLRLLTVQVTAGDTNAIRQLKALGPDAVPGLQLLLSTREPVLRESLHALGAHLPKSMGRVVQKIAGQPFRQRHVGVRIRRTSAGVLLHVVVSVWIRFLPL